MLEAVLSVLTIIYAIILLIVYHSIFKVVYFNLGNALFKELFTAMFLGTGLALLTVYAFPLIAVIGVIVFFVIRSKKKS